jgi:hypothetical protein
MFPEQTLSVELEVEESSTRAANGERVVVRGQNSNALCHITTLQITSGLEILHLFAFLFSPSVFQTLVSDGPKLHSKEETSYSLGGSNPGEKGLADHCGYLVSIHN